MAVTVVVEPGEVEVVSTATATLEVEPNVFQVAAEDTEGV